MKIRDSHASINGDPTVASMPNGLQIIDDHGHTLFELHLRGASLEINTSGFCKVDDQVYEGGFTIEPMAANRISLHKTQYVERPEK